MSYQDAGLLKKTKNIELEKAKLIEEGFTVIGEPENDKYNKRWYNVINNQCNHTYLKRYAGTPNCPVCIKEKHDLAILAIKPKRIKKDGNRICEQCGNIEKTKSKSKICMKCYSQNLKGDNSLQEIEKIQSWGYTLTSHTPVDIKFGKRIYSIINPNCNHAYESRYDNLRSMIEDRKYTTLPCGVCGQQNNMKKTLQAFLDKYVRTFDISLWEDYRKKARILSDEIYNANLSILNPANLTRGINDYHLDHKIPLSMCFRYKVSIEKASCLENLVLLPAKENLSKNWLRFDPTLLEKLSDNKIPWDEIGIGALCFFLENTLSVKLKIRDNFIYNADVRLVKLLDDKESFTEKLNEDVLYVRIHELKSKRNIIISRIAHNIGMSEKYHARKCTISELNTNTSKDFLEVNHLQGNVSATVKLGLYNSDELIAVMTFGKPRFNSGYEWELLRYATQSGTTVVGGPSKLLSAFIKLHSPKSIITYADRRWSSGNLYRQLGFKHESKLDSISYYYSDGEIIVPRYKAMKHKLSTILGNMFDEKLTETENMENAGYTKVFDIGNHVFTMLL